VEAAKRLGDAEEAPETTLAVSRFKRITQKLGPVPRDAVVKIATDIASTAVRQQMGL